MKNLLPLGSVVMVQEATKSLLIVGTTQIDEDDYLFDYIAVPFPEGYIDDETFLLFNHEDIEEVQYLGYVNVESQMYNKALEEAELMQEMGENEEPDEEG